mgnify:CR=1 FL=1|tara:strand:- start:127 stop:672 length:546 start_codon:yes stop_codon:yes gene_type:complete
MKTRTKITVALAVGIGLLVGSMGVASAKPHITIWVKAPAISIDEAKSSYTDSGRVPYFQNSNHVSGFSHHANVDKVQQEENLIDNIRVTLKETASQVQLDIGSVNVERSETSFEDVDLDSGTDHDINDTTVGVSDIWTSGGTTNIWTSGPVSSVWTSGGFTSIWTNGSATRLYANFVPFSF